ncbi:MAG: hypothetical protein HQK53_00415 [Oligoflexia bacterium]|nr:hypothetical protein [Oligoflexia bacterium]
MKGTVVKDNLEYIIETNNENWLQGDKVAGHFYIKKSSKDSNSNGNSNPNLLIHLAYGEFKKIHEKRFDAWKILETHQINQDESQDVSLKVQWEFSLPFDAPITDKNGSLYLLYGKYDKRRGSESSENGVEHWSDWGILQLNVDNHPYLNYFTETLDRFLRFKIKQKKFAKGWVEFKFLPPSSREWSNVDSLFCYLRMQTEQNKQTDLQMEIRYLFNTKGLELNQGQVAIQKNKKEFAQTLTRERYELYGIANHQGIQEAFKEISQQVLSKLYQK